MPILQPHPNTEPSPLPRRWPLLGLAIPLLVLILAAAAIWAGTTPAGAQDGYQPDEQLIDDVRGYSQETEKGYDHVLRWMRVLHTFDALDDVTAAEAQDYADNGWQRWDPVADALADLENAPDDYQPDEQLISAVRGYSQETESGYDHVLRWMRVLHAFGALDDMAAAEAQRYADNGWERWDPVAEELAQLEASTADPEPTLTPEPTPEPTPTATPEPTPTATPDPNRAPVVNTQAANYAAFVATGNAPRGVIVWKMFNGIFSDPDGDELTYSASVPADQLHLVDSLSTYFDVAISGGGVADFLAITVDGDDDWKAMTPPVPEQVRFTVSLTATDPGGRSATVQGKWLTRWESYPEVVSAVARGSSIELTFDWAVEDDPAPSPGQFTVHVVNGDGSSRTVAVSSVSVSGKVVRLELASGLEAGQSVTLDYAYDYPDDVPLQRAGGGDAAPGFTGQLVEMAVTDPPGEPQNFTINAEPGELDLAVTWDAVEGATSYQLAWRQADGEFEADNATTVADTSAIVTVSGYGQWEVRLQACNAGGCSPEVNGLVELVVRAVWLSLAPARDGEGQVRPRTFTATWDPVEGATSYTLRWRRAGSHSQAQDQPGGADSRGASTQGENQLDLPADQTSAEFTVPDDGKYQAELEAHNGGNEVIAQGDNEVNQADDQTDTTPPRLLSGEIDGDVITLYFSEAMDEDKVEGYFRVVLYSSWRGVNFTAAPREVKISGNKVVLVGFAQRWMQWRRIGTAAGDGARLYYYTRHAYPNAESLGDLAGNAVWTPYARTFDPTPYITSWRLIRSNAQAQAQGQSSGISRTRTIDLLNLTEPPLLEGATAHPHWLTLTFDETLDENSVPAGSAFRVMVNGSAVSLARVEPVAVAGNTVTLVLANPVSSTDTVTVGYSKPSNSPLRGLDGAVKSFSGQSVTNRVGAEPSVSQAAITSTPADGEAYAPGETIKVALTFTEAVTVIGAPRLKIKLAPNYGEKWADYSSGSGTTTLEFAYTVVEPDRSTRGVAVLRDALDLNRGAIRSVAMPATDAHLWYGGLEHDPGHMVDWHRSAPGVPWVTGVAITSDPGDDDIYALGDTIQVTATFSEAVTVDTTSGTPRLKISMGPDYGGRWSNYAGGSGAAELTFAYTVAEPNRSTRGVAVVGNTLELNGGAIRSATALPTDAHLRYGGLGHDRKHRVDGQIPALLSVAVTGTAFSLTFSEALDEGSVPPASAFTVQRTPQGGVEETVSLSGPPAIAGGAVVLTLVDPVLDTDTGVKVSYAKPTEAATNKLRDQAGNAAASFTDQAADATDTTPPRLLWGELDGDTVTLYFSEPLDEDSVPGRFRINLHKSSSIGNPPDYGRCRWGEPGATTFTAKPNDVFVSGNTAVAVGLEKYETVRARVGRMFNNFYYIQSISPTANSLRDLAGNLVSTPEYWGRWGDELWGTEHILLDNVTWLPSPARATVVGDRLTLTFDAPLDGGSRPAASAFTVQVNGSAVSLARANPVAVSGRNVTLTLAAAVTAGDDLTVSYAKPASSWLRNVICEYAESFSDKLVINSTGTSPASVAITSDTGDDDTYGLGETIRVQLTFSEAVDVTGKPRLKIDLNPAGRGEKLMWYESGSGTNSLTFARKVSEPSYKTPPFLSTAGIAVLANTVEPNGGSIRYASSGSDAYLEHPGLDHDPSHKVDWRRPPPGVPWVNAVAVSSDPGDDDTYGLGEAIRVRLTFSEAVDVTGAPRLKIKLDPDGGEKWANYASGSGATELTFTYQVMDSDTSPLGIAVLEDRLHLNGGVIQSAATQADAHQWYAGRRHDPNHKVDWRVPPPGVPTVDSVAITSDPGGDGTYGLGDTIRLTATFSEAVDVDTAGGTPRLKIKMDPNWGKFWANYERGSGTAALTFSYTVAEPNTSPQGIAVLAQTLERNGGVIRSVATQKDAHPWYAGLDHDPSHKVDWRVPPPGVPTVDSVAITSDPGDDDTYILGDTIRVMVTFSEAMEVDTAGGTPRLKIKMDPDWGEFWANYESGNGAATLTFAYTVVVPNTSPQGIAVLEQWLDLNDGAIRSVATNKDAHLWYEGLAHDPNHKVDWRAPKPGAATVTALVVSSDAGDDNTYGLGETIRVTVTFSEAVDVTGAPRLKIKMDPNWGEFWADYESGAGTTTLTFAYTVAEPNTSPQGIAVLEHTLEHGDATIRSAADQAVADLRHTGVDHDPNHKVDWRTPAPGVPSVSGVAITSDAGDDDTYGLGDTVRLTATFSEAVAVDTTGGTPRLKIKMDPNWGEFWANYESGSGAAELTFAYTVAEPNTSPQGIAVLEDTLELNGGTIRSTATTPVDAHLPHAGLGHDPNHKADWRRRPTSVTGVAITSVPADSDTYGLGEAIRLKLTFSEAVDVDTTGGAPRLKIKMDPRWGEFWANYASGSGTTELTFAYWVAEPNTSPQGIAVLEDTLELNGGAIRWANTQTGTHLAHAGLGHDPNHKADWRRTPPSVTGVAITSVPADSDTYGLGDTIRVTLTFREAVEVDTTGGAPRLKIKMDPRWGEFWADYASGSGTAELTFAYTVAEPNTSPQGIAVLGDTLGLNGGAIRWANTQSGTNLVHAGLEHDPSHKVYWLRPAPGIPWVTGMAITSDPGDDVIYAPGDTIQLTATFSEPVAVDTTGGAPRLKVRMALNWGEFWADYAGGSGTAELTFAYTVAETDRSTLGYGVAVLGNTLELSGGLIRSATATPVDAHLRHEGLRHDQKHRVDGKIPALLGVTVSGTAFSLTFSEALDEGSVPPASAFTVQRTPQGAAEETVGLSGPPAIAGGAVMLTLADPVLDTDTGVKVSYAKPTGSSGSRIRDKVGNEAASFTGQAADATDTTQPRLVRGEIDGDVITLYFSEPLDEESGGDGDRFRLTLVYYRLHDSLPAHGPCKRTGGSTFTAKPREVYVRGNTVVVVGLSEYESIRPAVDRIVNFNYYRSTAPDARVLRDFAGNPVNARDEFWSSEYYLRTRVINLENLTRLPYPKSATVTGNRLTLNFNAPMDGDSKPAAGTFTVKVGGNAVSLANGNAVTVSGRTVTLKLAAAVTQGDVVTVSYDKPASRPLQNVICEDAPSFSDVSATNFTGKSAATASMTSDAGDDTYGLGDTIRVRLSFSEAVTVEGAPRLKLQLDPDKDEKWADYESGSGTASLTFAYRVVEPDISTQGIAVLANTLELKYGALRYASSGEPAYLAHTGLDHDPNHKVDWQR